MREQTYHDRINGVPPSGTSNLSVLLMTYNEEANLANALRSVENWADDIYVVDSFSTDGTLDIARAYGCGVLQNRFESYCAQRNWALHNAPFRTEWVFVLDADEWVTDELRDEITALIKSNPTQNGFFIRRRHTWMGHSIRHGLNTAWILRLVRRGTARCEDRIVNEHLLVNGTTEFLKNEFVHEDHHGLTDWIAKHNHYATLEAIEILRGRCDDQVQLRPLGSTVERIRWLRTSVYGRAPRMLRPFFLFFYRYVIRGGFLDGRAGFAFQFLQAFWFHFLIDLKLTELERGAPASNVPLFGKPKCGRRISA